VQGRNAKGVCMRVGKDERAGERLYSCERAARITEGTFLATVKYKRSSGREDCNVQVNDIFLGYWSVQTGFMASITFIQC